LAALDAINLVTNALERAQLLEALKPPQIEMPLARASEPEYVPCET
jgi:hypothetical protein